MVNLYKRSREKGTVESDFAFGRGIATRFGEKFYRDIIDSNENDLCRKNIDWGL